MKGGRKYTQYDRQDYPVPKGDPNTCNMKGIMFTIDYVILQ